MLYLPKVQKRKVFVADTWREIEAEWQGGGAFIGRNSLGGMVQMGKMGDRPGVSPMELLLVGLAGCTGMDVVDIMLKKRESLKAFTVKVRAKRTEDYPQIFTEIEITYLIWGKGINPASVERAIQLSEDKYCSVRAMLKSTAEIRSIYQIIDSDSPGEE
jgi:putative redox protein